MKVFTRYLLRAHIGPFAFAFVALTGVILINTLAKELANLAGKGLPIDVVLEFFLLSLPANIALTLPMAVLVSVLYTFSTFASENEITALRASGVDLRRAAIPLVVSATLIAVGMVWFNNQVLPASNYKWRLLMTDVGSTRPLLALQEQTINPIETENGVVPYYLEAQEIDAATGLMRDVSIYDVSDDRITRTIDADSGHMAFNAARTDLLLTLYDGDVREVDFSDMSNFHVTHFRQQIMRMKGVSDRLERSAGSTYRTDRDMTIAMMSAQIDTLQTTLRSLRDSTLAGGAAAVEVPDSVLARTTAAMEESDLEDLGEEAASAVASLALPPGDSAGEAVAEASAAGDAAAAPAPASDPEEVVGQETDRYVLGRIENVQEQIRSYQVEIQKKFSIAAATLVFVLIGIPIALRFPRGGVGMVIGVSLLIFGIYYVGLIGGETLGDRGYVPPWVAMWLTNAIFGVLGIIGFMRLGHEQGTGRGGGWGEVPLWLRLPRRRRSEADAA